MPRYARRHLFYCIAFLGSEFGTFVAVAGAVILFRSLFAIADIPHNALIARMTRDSRARTRVAGYRMLFSSLASLLISLASPLILSGTSRAENLLVLALLAGAASTGTLVIAAQSAAEVDKPLSPSKLHPGLRKQLSAIVASPAARSLLFITMLTGPFPPLFSKSFLYFGKYVLEVPESVRDCLTAMVIGQLIGIPFWSWLGAHTEKSWALAASHAVAASGFLCMSLLEPTDWVVPAIGLWCGLGLGGLYMLIWAMAPDVVEQIQAQGGGRPEAMLFALLIFSMKVAISLGAIALGFALDFSGYRPGVAQTFDVRMTISLMTGFIPAVGGLVCVFVAARYRLGHAEHLHLKAIIDR